MPEKESTIRVVFRKFKGKDGDVIALLEGVPTNPYTVMSYMRVGQHGEANPQIIFWTKSAKPEEYQELLEELRSIYGENLVVGKRLNRNRVRESWVFGGGQ